MVTTIASIIVLAVFVFVVMVFHTLFPSASNKRYVFTRIPETVTFNCVSCDQKISTPSENAGKAAKCNKCGARIEIPNPEPVAAGFPPLKDRIRIKDRFLNRVDFFSGLPAENCVWPRESGPLTCPFCSQLIAEKVNYLGQTVSCQKCHAQFTAPNFTNPSGIPSEAVARALIGIATIAAGIFMWMLASQ